MASHDELSSVASFGGLGGLKLTMEMEHGIVEGSRAREHVRE